MKNWRKNKLLQDPDYRKREHRAYREKHYQELLEKSRIRRSKPENIKKARKYGNERSRELRLTVLYHYSGNKEPFCKQCGFNDIRALQLDHINDNGATDRRENGKSQTLMLSIIKRNFPQEYQVLCANCNSIKEMNRRWK